MISDAAGSTLTCCKCQNKLGPASVSVRGFGMMELLGLRCRKCGLLHPVRHHRNQSQGYVDVIGKFIFLMFAVYCMISRLYVAAACLISAIFIINIFMYFILIKLGLLMIIDPVTRREL